MKISSVQIFQSKPTNFRSNPVQTVKTVVPEVCDVFVKSTLPTVEERKNQIYNKILSNIGTVTTEDVLKNVKVIMSETGLSEQEVYKVLDKLTVYSGYKSLITLRDKLSEHNISNISNINLPYKSDSFPLCLTSVLSYIMSKKRFPVDGKSFENGLVLDSRLLDYMEKFSEEENRASLAGLNSKIIYIEDFENGYNFLNRNGNIKSFATSVINAVKENNGSLSAYLNSDTLERAKKLGLDVIVIPSQSSGENITPELIASRLNPIIPQREEFLGIIEEIFKSKNVKNEDEKNLMLDYIDTMLFPISVQKYSDYLRDINKKIDAFIEKNNRNPQNIFFIVPSIDKSFVVTNYAFRNINEKHFAKYVNVKFDYWQDKLENLDKIPNDSTVVVLDDCIISGLTLANESFKYTKAMKMFTEKNKDVSIILASAVGTKAGINNLRHLIRTYGRDKTDAVISGGIIPSWSFGSNVRLASKLGLDSTNPYVTGIALPYMGPDTNSMIIRPLLEAFLPFKEAQKPTNPKLDFAMFL